MGRRIPPSVSATAVADVTLCPAPAKPVSADAPSSLDIDDLETWAIIKALGQTSGNVSQAARVLGISRDTLHTKLKKNIDRESAIAAGAAGG